MNSAVVCLGNHTSQMFQTLPVTRRTRHQTRHLQLLILFAQGIKRTSFLCVWEEDK